MIKSFRGTVLLITGTLALAASTPLQAQRTLFDNTSTDLQYRLTAGTAQIGDQIILSEAGVYMTAFSFEYFGTNTASAGTTTFGGPVQARVRFYLNDGSPFNGVPGPGTQLFDSGAFAISPTPDGRATLNFTAGADFPPGGLFLPSAELTWSVQFTGPFVSTTDLVGVDIYSPPTVGQDYPDYWRFDNSVGWVLETNTVPVDFAARITGVPEPSSLTLALVGGLGLFFATRRASRKA